MTYAILVFGVLGIVILITKPAVRQHYLLGCLAALPLLLVDPFLRIGYFEQLSTTQLIWHFLLQALVAASFGGVAAVLYELVFSVHFTKQRSGKRAHLSVFLIGLFVSIGLFLFGVFPLVTAIVIGLLINTALLIAFRSDLLWDATFSAIGTGILYAIMFTIIAREPGSVEGLWFTSGLSGATIAGLPIEELLVIALFGSFFGPIYTAAKSLYER